MAGSIIMPKTGMAMEEGTILQWLKKEGDPVEKGEPIVEVETDKTTMEVESDFEGTVLKILRDEGEVVPVTQVIAWVGKPGEAVPEAEPAAAPQAAAPQASAEQAPAEETAAAVLSTAPAAEGRIKATPAAKRIAGEKGISLSQVSPSGRSGEIRARDVEQIKEVRATPVARYLAEKEGIDLTTVSGSGVDGKVFSRDLLSQPSGSMHRGEVVEDTRVKLTKIQQITGQRMLRSHQEIPTVTINTDADVTSMLDVRAQMNGKLEHHFTINDFVLKAAVRALEENPRVNSVLDGDELIYRGEINLGVAVATPRGLLVPVIRRAGGMSLTQLSSAAAGLAASGREGKLNSDDLAGGTFTVSNVGMFGITSFSPIINQPEAAILGVCAVADRIALANGEPAVKKIMGLSLTFDHRIVDGAEACRFLQAIREFLEEPYTMLV